MKKLRVLICVLPLVLFCVFLSGFAPANAYSPDRVYVGGFPVGISLDVGGLLIENITGVETEYGTVYVDGLDKGDVLTKINDKDVRSAEDVTRALTEFDAKVELIRSGETVVKTVKPVIEVYSNKPRLGIKVKDKIYGVGTVTLVRSDGTYAALGHEIYDAETGVHIPVCSGTVHGCKIIGIKQGKRGEAGAILASIVADKVYGDISCNNTFGIAGRYTADIPETDCLPIAARSEVHPGAAKIRTCVDGKPEYYDIEIIKAAGHGKKKEKSLVIRVTDERLLKLTGGIVRGMSGSPIVQDGKLAGAVTHVFLNDFTKGYGVYADCLNAA